VPDRALQRFRIPDACCEFVVSTPVTRRRLTRRRLARRVVVELSREWSCLGGGRNGRPDEVKDFAAPFVSAADPAAHPWQHDQGQRVPGAGWAQAVCGGATAACGWYTDSLVSTLRLDEPTMVVEERRIVATISGLTEIRVPLAMPGMRGAALLPRLIYGGELLEFPTGGWGRGQTVGVRLPTRLACGRGHQFGLAVVRASGGTVPDRHLHTCMNRCDLLVARVRFTRGWRPSWVRRVDGLRLDELNERCSREELLPVDSVGEVVARFHDLEAGRCYGLCWGRRWSSDSLYRPAGGRHRGAPAGGFLRDRQPLRTGSPPTNG
jgi:hypothetical protein